MSERKCNSHLAGEFFVCAELAKRGLNVSLTMGNAKAVDIYAEHDGRAVSIQVKAIAHRRNVGWPLPIDRTKILDGVVFVLVICNDPDEAPTYYVVPPEEVRKLGRWYKSRAILEVRKVKDGPWLNAWHLIEERMEPLAVGSLRRR
jgi:hypothetical protein